MTENNVISATKYTKQNKRPTLLDLRKLLARKKGQGLVEYVFIISLVAIGLILALVTLGSKLADFFNSVADLISQYSHT